MLRITLDRGETFNKVVSFIRKSDRELLDLTGFEILFTAKKNSEDLDKEDKSAIIKKTLIQTEIGKSILSLSEEDTFHPSGRYACDFKIRRRDGKLTKLGHCELIIKGVATNR